MKTVILFYLMSFRRKPVLNDIQAVQTVMLENVDRQLERGSYLMEMEYAQAVEPIYEDTARVIFFFEC